METFYKRADNYKQANKRGGKKYEHIAIAEKARGIYADPNHMYIKPNTAHARHKECRW